MLPLSHRVAFLIFAVLCLALTGRGFYRLYLRIIQGSNDTDARKDGIAGRAWYAFRTTLLQTRVFRDRVVLSIFHSFIFYAFVLYILVNLLDAVEGFYKFTPFTWPHLVVTYKFMADALSALSVVGVIALVLRRFVLKGRRAFLFNDKTLLHPGIRAGYIKQDSIIVSAFILFHVGSRVLGNAARLSLSGTDMAQPFASLVSRAINPAQAMTWMIFGYWGALGSVLLFLAYFPYSKHIHLLFAPVKYFFRRNEGSGQLPAPKIDVDDEATHIGAATLPDLAWPRLLDAYACIQCNRCQDVCPASQTGKSLSPAALEINKRMVLNDIAREVSAFSPTGRSPFESGKAQGPQLLEAVLSPEALWACTTCGACMEVCPTQNEQMLDIIDIRRSQVMMEGKFPPQLQTAFRGMERMGNPWGIARDKRMDWAESLHVPTIEEVPDPDVLYWVGCAASYDAGAQKTARAVVQLLAEAQVRFAVLGKREPCTGDTARRAGNEFMYQQLAATAIKELDAANPKLVLASCPHCVNIIDAEYPQLGGNFNVMHHTEYFASMVESGQLRPTSSGSRITFHDPCYLGRHRGTYDQPRSVLKVLTNDYVELPRTKADSFCCGAGGAQFWKEEEPGTERISENRFREARQQLGTDGKEKVLAVGCPFCKSMLQSAPSAGLDDSISVKDVAELLLEGVQRSKGDAGPVAHADRSRTLSAVTETVSSRMITQVYPSVRPDPSVLTESLILSEPSKDAGGLLPVAAMAEDSSAFDVTPRKKWVPSTTKLPFAEPQDSIAAAIECEPATAPPTEHPVEVAGPTTPAPRKKWKPREEKV